jgi:hypothetical protein
VESRANNEDRRRSTPPECPLEDSLEDRGSLALRTVGVRVRRPVAALIVIGIALTLILWLHAADTATRFRTCCCW